jgi:hypothetical protein
MNTLTYWTIEKESWSTAMPFSAFSSAAGTSPTLAEARATATPIFSFPTLAAAEQFISTRANGAEITYRNCA